MKMSVSSMPMGSVATSAVPTRLQTCRTSSGKASFRAARTWGSNGATESRVETDGGPPITSLVRRLAEDVVRNGEGVKHVMKVEVRGAPDATVALANPFFIDLPAFLFILFWFWIQLFSGVAALGGEGGGVAWWAHIGGFLAGFGFVLLSGIRPLAKASRAYERARYYFDPRTGRYVRR